MLNRGAFQAPGEASQARPAGERAEKPAGAGLEPCRGPPERGRPGLRRRARWSSTAFGAAQDPEAQIFRVSALLYTYTLFSPFFYLFIYKFFLTRR